VATPEEDNVAWPAHPVMYIDTNPKSSEAVGFAFSNATLNGTMSATGFGLYGGWAFHKGADAEVEMKFYATPTEDNDVYL
jgi:hypothetical protein